MTIIIFFISLVVSIYFRMHFNLFLMFCYFLCACNGFAGSVSISFKAVWGKVIGQALYVISSENALSAAQFFSFNFYPCYCSVA